jgi:hypothetical protein
MKEVLRHKKLLAVFSVTLFVLVGYVLPAAASTFDVGVPDDDIDDEILGGITEWLQQVLDTVGLGWIFGGLTPVAPAPGV